MHHMHYKDYIHHGLAAEKTPPPLPQGRGEPSGWVGGGVGVPAHIYIYAIRLYIHNMGLYIVGVCKSNAYYSIISNYWICDLSGS